MHQGQNPPLPQPAQKASILSKDIKVLTLRATLFVWLTLILLLITFLFHIIAFSIVEWSHVTKPLEMTFGLWKVCQTGSCSNWAVAEITDAHRCVQAFATLSFLLLFASILWTLVYVYYEELHADGLTHKILLALRVATVLFLIITFSVWSDHWQSMYPKLEAEHVEGSLGAGFALEVVCFVFELISTGLLGADFVLNVRRQSAT